jgi:hypothetical protein
MGAFSAILVCLGFVCLIWFGLVRLVSFGQVGLVGLVGGFVLVNLVCFGDFG